VAVFGAQCGAHRASDLGVACPTPVVAHAVRSCAVTPAQLRTIAAYYDRTSLHHRAQLHYAFHVPTAASRCSRSSSLNRFPERPISYEVLNPPDAQAEGLVYERCGNLVHSGAPYGI